MVKCRMVYLRGYVPSPSEIEELLRQQPDKGDPQSTAQPAMKKLMIHSQAKSLTYGTVSNLHNVVSANRGDAS